MWSSLAGGLFLAGLAVLLAAGSAAAGAGVDTGSDSTSCRKLPESVPKLVPGAEVQDGDCLKDLTTAGTQKTDHTNRNDWDGLNAKGTKNPTGVGGLQVDGYFPDNSHTNTDNNFNHDSQFVVRFPNKWNGKVVITGAPGVRAQYANDFIISDFVLARGYAFAATDKGNTGTSFYDDGSAPGGSVAEWNRRVTQLTKATKAAAETYYGKSPKRTYITGISNGGYLTRYALEHDPKLYDGGVDWEGTLFRAEGPNLLTFLPPTLRNYPEYAASSNNDQSRAHENIIRAGFARGSEFLWQYHYSVYWDLTQRIYREEFDPNYDGALKAGIPFCQPGTSNCDANYNYYKRPQSVKDAVAKVQNTGRIGKPLITLQGDLDTLLPIRDDSDVYNRLVQQAGRGGLHRYLVIGDGNHVDGLYDNYPNKLRPILPCYRDAFLALDRHISSGAKLPKSGFIPKPKSGDVVNSCNFNQRAPRPYRGPQPAKDGGGGNTGGNTACTITGTSGNDRLRGTSGRDVICGGGGNDELFGFGGNDLLRGGSGNDVLRGGSGDDSLEGGSGKDTLYGNEGKDHLDARDGVRQNDSANGGTGRDSCAADRGDTVRSCP